MDPSLSIYDAWLLSLTCVAAATDARNGTIPNWLTLPSLALAPLAHALHAGPGALAWSLAGSAACALVPLVMFRSGAMGGGDVKLFAAAGALAGAHTGLELQMLTYVLAACVAVSRLGWRGELSVVLHSTWRVLTQRLRTRAASDASASDGGLSVRLGVAAFAACVVLAVKCALERPP